MVGGVELDERSADADLHLASANVPQERADGGGHDGCGSLRDEMAHLVDDLVVVAAVVGHLEFVAYATTRREATCFLPETVLWWLGSRNPQD